MNETFKKLGLFLVAVALNSVGYGAAQALRPEGFLVTTWIDSFIPYVSWFVVPYLLFFPLVLVPFFLYWKDYPGYRTMALSLIAVLAVSLVVYLAFQTTATRAEVEPNDFFNWGVWMIYSVDKPLNNLPSLHVALSTIAALFAYLKSRRIGLGLAPLAVLIILSTVFIKQHAFLDVVAGLALTFGVFRFRGFFRRISF